ncbi:hypothetical protein MYU51_003439 [Penicillium brevicompactum]|uniref:uncharacterized protein n=1 Tax=Penicillium brevicompactum TaxID=5074 RepID=UPI00253F80C3|nr:uncharacterized protein N7506_002531 [Penicillium brevicompactum]KAJ5344166.1 hypothetical protein N7506_002531 [Penicillium brevicompactum]
MRQCPETLKRKRDDLEGQVQGQRARIQQDEQHEPPCSPANRVEHPQGNVNSGLQDVADTTVQAAMGEVGLLSRSAMAEPRDEMSGFSQELAMGRMVRATIAISGKDPTKSMANPHSAIIPTCDQANSLTRDIALPYVTRFIESMEPQFLHLRESRIWEEFETYFREANDDFRSLAKGRVISFNVYMNTAMGMLLSPDSTGLQGFASSLQAIAMRMFAGILESGSRFDILHCMLSLIIYSMQTSLGGSTWHLLGLAMQKAITFGFYKDPNPAHNLPSEQLRDRRDIFWGLYTMDRTISIVMDRPFNIEDNDIHILVRVYSKSIQIALTPS